MASYPNTWGKKYKITLGWERKWAFQVTLEVKNPSTNAGDIKRHRFDPWVWRIPWKRA